MEIGVLVKTAFRHYIENFTTALGFGLLLVFVFLFTQFSNAFISSGSVFIYYNLVEPEFFSTALLFLTGAVFLFFYSVLVCLMVFAVRNHLSKVKLHYYLTQKIKKFAVKYFYFSVILSLLAFTFVVASSAFNVSFVFVFFVLFVVFSFMLFVPQAIVVDENSVLASVFNNFEFISKNFSSFILVNAVGIALLFLLVLAEFAIDSFFFVGNVFSLVLTFLFVMPFIEALKTRLYMKKFALIQ